MRSLEHYQQRLPEWRWRLRQRCIPLIRWETQYLAAIQDHTRSPVLDSYFAITANLGTHTFYMIGLPVLFWCGWTSIGRAFVHVLALGVIVTGYFKDLLCLPRPLSPPLRRITMSGTAALEYGFPSTHSTNAMSVAVYMFILLHSETFDLDPSVRLVFECVLCWFALTLMVGRLYCGMHGFLDVGVGGFVGVVLALSEAAYGEWFDLLLYSSSYQLLPVIVFVACALIRVHPEPADDCPCFDDSVAFAGVMIGVECGNWLYARSGWASDFPAPATVPFDLHKLGWFKVVARIAFGVASVIAWRGLMKPVLLRCLPPVFRVIERLGLSLPRRFFIQASQYEKVPSPLKDDEVLPSVSKISSMMSSLRQPRRRAVSVGPQSVADAFEVLAYHEHKRSQSSGSGTSNRPKQNGVLGDLPESFRTGSLSSSNSTGVFDVDASEPSLRIHRLIKFARAAESPIDISDDGGRQFEAAGPDEKHSSKASTEIVSIVMKPRVRYDVEVVTKLIVYAGIGFVSVYVDPIVFEYIGLGVPR
ncbi:MAG: hypothetical protein M1815_005904 [Lichina confinis]|nr:MAG: hypothetical protein M1815_005904 [Lichina confinis]